MTTTLTLLIIISLICGFQNSLLYLENIKSIDYEGLRGFKPLSYLVLYLIFFVNYLIKDLTPIRYIVYFTLTYGQLTKSYLFATIRDSIKLDSDFSESITKMIRS